MSESILERLALWHAAAVAEITEANGYHQTLSVTRAEELEISGSPRADLTAIVCLGECSEDRQRTSGKVFWRQVFDTFVLVLGKGGTDLAVDNRITRIVADIHARIGRELAAAAGNRGRYCDQLAYRIDLLPWDIGVLEKHDATLVAVPVALAFDVCADNPYSQ
jgi:hypothetical protein